MQHLSETGDTGNRLEAMLKKRVPEEVDPAKPGGIALGRRPMGIGCETSGSTSSEVVLPATSLLSGHSQAITPSIACPGGASSPLVRPMVVLLEQPTTAQPLPSYS